MPEKENVSRLRAADFARICGTNKRTLHHYDQIGLFAPALRGENGYRYYSQEQYDVFMVIAALKELGMPLLDIKAYLDRRDPERLSALLDQQEAEVERGLAQLRRIQTMIRTKRKLLEQGRRVVCGQVFFEVCPPALLILSDPIRSADPAVAAPILYAHLARCHREGWNEGYPFGAMISAESLAAGRFDEYACYFTQVEHPSAGVPVFEKPAGRYAAICLQGDYHRARGAYRQLLEEISARGLRPVGCSYKEGLVGRDRPEGSRPVPAPRSRWRWNEAAEIVKRARTGNAVRALQLIKKRLYFLMVSYNAWRSSAGKAGDELAATRGVRPAWRISHSMARAWRSSLSISTWYRPARWSMRAR